MNISSDLKSKKTGELVEWPIALQSRAVPTDLRGKIKEQSTETSKTISNQRKQSINETPES